MNLNNLDLVVLTIIEKHEPVTAIEISNFLRKDKYRIYESLKTLKKLKYVSCDTLRPKQYFLKNEIKRKNTKI